MYQIKSMTNNTNYKLIGTQFLELNVKDSLLKRQKTSSNQFLNDEQKLWIHSSMFGPSTRIY
ncbi:hypothetical protein PPL_11553 [Heterostelium album PN500]|uniref:Uncharacterized protein n=1 Tax=Heterostelium pallidum (strain ATCC 26659 / Pp 5 / PN500) TaxID=670386 RepID=D3BVG2_HETP5|nr:hypothetical protein PPL_11553 [Heterostelium album PN500]EFA74585.1 hypothetical protein PPL_11553 [Heterostelium album PN500]|eukprot:XP_020426719.1 hypothetical protein PPL_11553 [Heterostelium album PN500]